jgi:putative spermidine/putrescine transport system permease protein
MQESAVRRRSIQILGLPALVFLLFFFVMPLLNMLQRSITDPAPGLGNYAALFQSNIYLRVLIRTFQVALVVTLLCLALGYPTAYFISGIRSRRLRNLILVLVIIPFWTSLLVRTYAWMAILGRTGILNNALVAMGLIEQPLRLLHTRFAVLVGMTHILLPFMILTLNAVMQGIDHRLTLAASTLGANPLRAFATVFLPLSMPGVASGSLLIFIMALGFYVTPALLGGQGDIMISMMIESRARQLLEWNTASTLSAVLLIVTLAMLMVYHKLIGLDQLWSV